MLFTEWNLEEAIAVRCEEAREEEREDTWEKCAKNMLSKGYSVDEVIGVTSLSHEQIRGFGAGLTRQRTPIPLILGFSG